MEERRLLLAVALSLLVLTAYQLMFAPAPAPEIPATPDPGVEREAGPAEAPAAPQPAAAPEGEPGAAAEAAAAAEREVPAAASVADVEERRIEVSTADVEMALTNRGAGLLAWRLREYRDARGRPEEMVQTVRGARLPLALQTGDEALDRRLGEALFVPSAVQLAVSPSREATLRFEYRDEELQAEKTLRIPGEGYLISVGAQVVYRGERVPVRVSWGPGVSNPSDAEREVQGYQEPQAIVMTPDGEISRIDAGDLDGSREFPQVRWAGIASQYFAAIWVPPEGRGGVVARSVEVPGPEGEVRTEPTAGFLLPPGAGEGQLYIGPKDYFILSNLNRGLARVVDVGDWIGPIVVPLMRLLRWVHGHVGNYGWSIVVLTVLINLVMAPLRHISIANSAKMAKLTPEMKVIQERYRKVPALDPRRQEMQKEVSALYARHGMSMSSQLTVGCLPLLLTMPFLIGFYRVLQIFIELRGASFLWVPDLSQKDPLFVTPLLMGASMFAMQRMTPTTLDPAQQRMMTIMPLMFVGMFLWAPAGLNLYWLSSNVCSLLQQGVTLRVVRAREGAPARSKAPPGKSSPGKAPGGKSARQKERRRK